MAVTESIAPETQERGSGRASCCLCLRSARLAQYLTVVWRYKWNEWSTASTGRHLSREAASFALRGIFLGVLGFWIVPSLIDFARTGHITTGMAQTSSALACAWLFINVHHYLLDNVMWRKGNPSVAKHLFGHGG